MRAFACSRWSLASTVHVGGARGSAVDRLPQGRTQAFVFEGAPEDGSLPGDGAGDCPERSRLAPRGWREYSVKSLWSPCDGFRARDAGSPSGIFREESPFVLMRGLGFDWPSRLSVDVGLGPTARRRRPKNHGG